MKKLLILLVAIMAPLVCHAAGKVILAAQTDAGNTSAFSIPENRAGTLVIYASGGTHTAAEYSDIQISHDGGTTWADLYQDLSQMRLHSTNTAATIYGPGTFRVAKEATTPSVGIYLLQNDFL